MIAGGNIVVSFGREGPPLYHQDEPMCAFLAQLGILPIPLPLYDPFQEAELPLPKGFFLSEKPTSTLASIVKTTSDSNALLGPLYYTKGFSMKVEASKRRQTWNLLSPAWTTMVFSPDLKEGQLPGSDLSLIAAFQSQPVGEDQESPKIGRVLVLGSSYFLSSPSLL